MNRRLLDIADNQITDTSGWGNKEAQKAKRIRLRSKIYFIQQGLSGPIKIGVSANPSRRLVNLQVANPFPLKIIGMIPGTVVEEEKIQKLFEKFRIQGEWFSPDEEIINFIKENCGKKG